MKISYLFLCLNVLTTAYLWAQEPETENFDKKEISNLVDAYSLARDLKDPNLLSDILTDDIDQLVSSGRWRKGKVAAIEGMMQSSETNPGERSLAIEEIRFLTPDCAVADARYVILSADGSARKMWSTFLVVRSGSQWKISAIRNMLPAGASN